MSSSHALTRFSTEDLPERDRFPIWREAIGRSMLKCDMMPVGDDAFRWNATLCSLPDVTITNYVSTPFEMTRSRSQAQDGDDSFVLGVVRRGSVIARQERQEASSIAGEAMLWSNEQSGAANFSAGIESHLVAIPRHLLTPLVAGLDSLAMSVVPRGSAALRLLSSYVSTLFDDVLAMSPELKALSATHIQDLVVITLGATRDAAEIAKGRGVRVARLKVIKAYIETNLTNRDLSLESLALHHKISPRYVRDLFGSEDTSFTDHVLKMRLLRAHRALCKPGSHVKISTIAFESGFGDLSHFNRAFRRYFGLAPSDVRALALKN
ncbi:AraC family transcriptional regulator [Mesorhizobium huakuii]|uniref:AraC family transcriptional regulator n=1 Tax=Mesorhizobium huakuii TaxID=28104 RepID=UPI0024E0F1FA|nr:AraC family transcriptional regulator [Mesorhizobium huakuii]